MPLSFVSTLPVAVAQRQASRAQLREEYVRAIAELQTDIAKIHAQQKKISIEAQPGIVMATEKAAKAMTAFHEAAAAVNQLQAHLGAAVSNLQEATRPIRKRMVELQFELERLDTEQGQDAAT